jgi:hypothetical protein
MTDWKSVLQKGDLKRIGKGGRMSFLRKEASSFDSFPAAFLQFLKNSLKAQKPSVWRGGCRILPVAFLRKICDTEGK